jgi:hypothetical protein
MERVIAEVTAALSAEKVDPETFTVQIIINGITKSYEFPIAPEITIDFV